MEERNLTIWDRSFACTSGELGLHQGIPILEKIEEDHTNPYALFYLLNIQRNMKYSKYGQGLLSCRQGRKIFKEDIDNMKNFKGRHYLVKPFIEVSHVIICIAQPNTLEKGVMTNSLNSRYNQTVPSYKKNITHEIIHY